MAQQAFYTSAERGLANFSGFQFVAVSQGMTAADQNVVMPYLGYERPPGASAYPDADELAAMPVAFGYAPLEGRACLTRCRYAGTDYSQRAGNFTAMAVLATDDELEYARPIELWEAPWWADEPSVAIPADDLPTLTINPGDAVTPDQITQAVARRDRTVLAGLIDALLAALGGDSKSILVVAEDVSTVVVWIAAATCSLSFDQARSVSFITYSGAPDRARYRLVGTTPAAWVDSGRRQPAFLVDDDNWRPRQQPSGYALAVTDCWQQGALGQLDDLIAVVEQVVAATAGSDSGQARRDRDSTTALILLSNGGSVDAPAEPLADLTRRAGTTIPLDLWRRLADRPDLPTKTALELAEVAAGTGRAGVAGTMLANAVSHVLGNPSGRRRLRPVRIPDHETLRPLTSVITAGVESAPTLEELGARLGIAEMFGVRLADQTVNDIAARLVTIGAVDVIASTQPTTTHRELLLDGVIDGLESAAPAVRDAVLTSAVCDLLEPLIRFQYPRVARVVAVDVGRRRSELRMASSRQLTHLRFHGTLPSVDLAEDLARIWPRITASEVHRLIEDPAGRNAPAEIAGLAVGAWVRGGLTTERAQALADRVLLLKMEVLSVPAAGDAQLVVALRRLSPSLASITDVAVTLLRLNGYTTEVIHNQVVSYWVDAFARARPGRREKPGAEALQLLDQIVRYRSGDERFRTEVDQARKLLARYRQDDNPDPKPRRW